MVRAARRLVLIGTLLAGTSARAEEGMLESVLGDGSSARVQGGVWYAWWSPTAIGGSKVGLSIDPTLLTETGVSLQVGKRANLGVEYFADNLFDSMKFEASKQIGAGQTEAAARLLVAALKLGLTDDWSIKGRATLGRFQGTIKPEKDTQITVDGQALGSGSKFGWSSHFSVYDASALYDLGKRLGNDEGHMRAGLGLRVSSFRTPVPMSFVASGPVRDPASGQLVPGVSSIVATSDYASIGAQIVLLDAELVRDRGSLAAEVAFFYGFGGYESDLVGKVSGSSLGFDMSARAGHELFKLGPMGVWGHLGFRLIGQLVRVGDPGSAKGEPVTLKGTFGSIPSGTRGEVTMTTSDYFYGPTATLALHF